MKNKPMDNAEFCAKIATMVKDAEGYATQLAKSRDVANKYFRGEMDDMPPRKGWSTAISLDLRSTMNKALPSVMRTIFGSDKVVEYKPMSEGDEPIAEQATQYINHRVMLESGAYDAIYDAVHDALLLRNGVLSWRVEKIKRVEGGEYTNLDEAGLINLVSSDEVEVLEQKSEMAKTGPVYSIKIKRTLTDSKIRLVSVPMEEFLISSDATSVDDARLVGQARILSRSDLIAMGYDADKVDRLPDVTMMETNERYVRRKYKSATATPAEKENQPIIYYDLHVKVDYDGDGIAETRRLCFAGGVTQDHLLVNEYANEAPYADIVAERSPHQWEGISLADDLIPVQRVKTALIRYALDNVYWQNTRQPIVPVDAMENPESFMRPEFGRPIVLATGYKASDIGYNEVPFVANNLLQIMAFWDQQSTERTGIDNSSSGLDPDALQNVTAKASAMIEQKGIARVEMLIRTICQGGLRKAFKSLLKLVIENQDKVATVRLNDKWVDFDPKSWNAEMDVSINIGLGAGTRERDMMMMQMVIGMQEKLLANLGPDNPFVKPDNVWNSLSAMIEASGLKTPTMYFTQPDEAEVNAALEARKNQKPIELQVIEAKAMADKALKEAELPLEMRRLELQTQAAAEKERAQGQAAVEEAVAIAQIEAQAKADENALKRYEIDQKLILEREKLALEREQIREQKLLDQKNQASKIAPQLAKMKSEYEASNAA